MNSVMTKMEKPHAPNGRMTPSRVPLRLTCTSGRSPITSDSGIAMTSSGNIIVARMTNSAMA